MRLGLGLGLNPKPNPKPKPKPKPDPNPSQALAAHACHATEYHRELRRRSAVLAFPRELLAAPRPNASVHGDGLHPGPRGHVAMAASVEARRNRCRPPPVRGCSLAC